MSVPFYLLHSLLFKLPNKGMENSFPPLKLLNKGKEEYSKMILFISFHSLLPNELNEIKCLVWEFINEWNEMELNDHKRMEMNGMECI